MVAYCCICKTEQGAIENVSFHRIPKNETIKAKWFTSIGRTVNQRSSVCSLHFEEKDFCYKPFGNIIRRFLLPTAIPSSILTRENRNNSTFISTNENADSKATLSENEENDQLDIKDIIIKNDDCIESNFNNLSDIDSSVEHKFDVTQFSENSKSSIIDSAERRNDENTKALTLQKKTSSVEKSKRICTLRYVGDLSRKDFTSERSWQIVHKYILNSKSEKKMMNQKINRLIRKVEYFQSLLDYLKKIINKKQIKNAMH